jgi:hypothetical protein
MSPKTNENKMKFLSTLEGFKYLYDKIISRTKTTALKKKADASKSP